MIKMSITHVQKIGTVEILPVRRSGRRYYLPLRKDFIDALGLEVGDRLRVKIVEKIIPIVDRDDTDRR